VACVVINVGRWIVCAPSGWLPCGFATSPGRSEAEDSEARRSGETGQNRRRAAHPAAHARRGSKAKRRSFTVDYKKRIFGEADAATEPGAIGAFSCQEGLYSSHLTTWRQERTTGINQAFSKKRGPKVRRNPIAEENAKLRRQNEHLTKELRKAQLIIDVQKEVAALPA
jgi:transposase